MRVWLVVCQHCWARNCASSNQVWTSLTRLKRLVVEAGTTQPVLCLQLLAARRINSFSGPVNRSIVFENLAALEDRREIPSLLWDVAAPARR